MNWNSQIIRRYIFSIIALLLSIDEKIENETFVKFIQANYLKRAKLEFAEWISATLVTLHVVLVNRSRASIANLGSLRFGRRILSLGFRSRVWTRVYVCVCDRERGNDLKPVKLDSPCSCADTHIEIRSFVHQPADIIVVYEDCVSWSHHGRQLSGSFDFIPSWYPCELIFRVHLDPTIERS